MLDVFFITIGETDSQWHFDILKEHAPHATWVDGESTIFASHKLCADQSRTDHFYVVDADAIIVDAFDFDFRPRANVEAYPGVAETDCVHVWSSVNPVNGLEYGYGGVKCFPKKAFRNLNKSPGIDMTMSIGCPFVAHQEVSNITYFNTTEFESWKSAFRESVKLTLQTISNPNDEDAMHRLCTWCNVADTDSEFYEYVLYGARQGMQFAEDYSNNQEILQFINDFSWLRETFKESAADV